MTSFEKGNIKGGKVICFNLQKHDHQAFVDRLNEINLDEVDENQQEYLEELVEFLRNWLVNHILKMDKLIPVEG